MPLTSDEQIVSTAEEILTLFKGAFGPHPGKRPGKTKRRNMMRFGSEY
jgi:hypothetical protein